MTEKVTKKLEDLTLDEIKAQLAIYHNLYQKRRKKTLNTLKRKGKDKDRNITERKKEKKQTIPTQNQKLETENTTILRFF